MVDIVKAVVTTSSLASTTATVSVSNSSERKLNMAAKYPGDFDLQKVDVYYLERENRDNCCVGTERYLLNSRGNPCASLEDCVDEAFAKMKIGEDGEISGELNFEHFDELSLEAERRNTCLDLNLLDDFEAATSYATSRELYSRKMRHQDTLSRPEITCDPDCIYPPHVAAREEINLVKDEYSPPPEKEVLRVRLKALQENRQERLYRKREERRKKDDKDKDKKKYF